jgi:hypothetical protein
MIWHSEDQVYRASDVQQFSDATAVLTGTLVNITLLVPRTVVVTFSADTFTDTNLYVGLSVNSGDCAIYGPAALTSESKFHTTTLRWIVTKDEVKAGRNSFEVCVLTGTGAYDLRTLTVERVQ